MLPEDSKALFGRFVEEVFNRGNLDAVATFFTDDAVIHDPGLELRGPAALQAGVQSLRAAFPDLHLVVEDRIAEGDRLAVRYRGEGTHRGPWHGIAATGRRISYTGILILRFEGGKIAEFWAQPDLLGLLQQLGAIPSSSGSSSGSG